MTARLGLIVGIATWVCLTHAHAQSLLDEDAQKPRPLRPVVIGAATDSEGTALSNQRSDARLLTPAAPDPSLPGNLDGDPRRRDSIVRLILGRGRILTTPTPIGKSGDIAVVAVGDPSIVDFEVLPNPRMIRLIGKRPGITELTLVTSEEETLIYELQVEYDLALLEARLRQVFPTALVRITQLGNHLILEGQARDPQQSLMIENAVRAYLDSASPIGSVGAGPLSGGTSLTPESFGATSSDTMTDFAVEPTQDGQLFLRAMPETTPRAQLADSNIAQIINLIKLPGVQQVMLQVRIAELNRTALREIGGDTFFEWGPGNIFGTKIGGSRPPILQGRELDSGNSPSIGPELGSNSTVFGLFPSARMDIILRALRQNAVLRILAEPNLVSLSGHEASFLAGGEFPVPVAQGNSLGAGNITVQYKQFGVQLNFVPFIQDDDVIRLEVRPEVSSIDDSLGTTLVLGGEPTPGINTRRVHTTVQMREGETLALAGLLQVELEANTSRIPGLGDLPYIGPLFSNTSHDKTEKELLVLVTPFLVSPMNACEVPSLPGADIQDPNDLEFYFLNRIEGRTGRPFRSTTSWDDPCHLIRKLKLERDHACGPVGFSSFPQELPESR